MEYISPILVIAKIDRGKRLILNLKSLNANIKYIHFKMHGLKEILKIGKYCFMASLSIKDAYYLIPVKVSFQKYLKFNWKKKLH